MSDSNDDTETSVLESIDTEELLEGTQLEDATDDDKNAGEVIGRAIGAVIGRQIGELVGRMVTERLRGSGEEETHDLTISVEDTEGDPVEGATVSVEDEGTGFLGGLIGGGESAETDDDGDVTVQLEDGEYTIDVDADEGSAGDDVSIEGGDEEVSLTVESEDEDGEDESEDSDENEDEDGDDEDGTDDE